MASVSVREGAEMTNRRRYSVRPVIQALSRIGLCVPSVFQRAQLSEVLTKDSNLALDASASRRLFVAAAEEYGSVDFGFQLALQYARTPYGIGYFAFISSQNVEAAVKAHAKYKPQVAPIGCSAAHDAGNLKVEIYQTTSEFPVDSNVALIDFAYIIELLRNSCDGLVDIEKISLREVSAAHDAYHRFFSCEIEEGPVDAMWISSTCLGLPLHSKNPEIDLIAKERLERLYFSESDQKDFCQQVRETVRDNILTGRVGAKNAAQKLGISVRTLSRRLENHGLRFVDIQNDIQQVLSIDLLSDFTMSIDEVAFRVGYKEKASFYRAFKTWHGVTPAQMRRSWTQEQNKIA